MKPRTLLILFLVVAALGAFIWFVERDLPSTNERAERSKKVLPVERDAVTAIEIQALGAVTRLEKVILDEAREADDDAGAGLALPAEEDWRITEPLAARADREAVESLIDTLTGLEKQRTLEDYDPAGLGLAAPRATVTLTAGDEVWTLQVGEEIPASSSLIVTRSGAEEAFVVADAFWSDVAKPAGDWRTRQAFPAERDEVAEISLWTDQGEVVLMRDEEGGGFRIAEPFADEAHKEKVDELLGALTGLEIDAFLDAPQDLGTLGLDPAAGTVTVRLAAGGDPISIRIGSTKPDDGSVRRVAVGEQVFEAETTLLELLAEPAAVWQSTAWTRLETYEVDSVEVRGNDAPLRLERSSGDWLREGAEIPYPVASDLLYSLRDAEAEGLRGRSEVDLSAAPLYEVRLTAGERAETLRVHPGTESGHPAERDGRGYVLFLSAETVGALAEKIEAARTAVPLPASEDTPATSD